MKRGLIAWDKQELSPDVLRARARRASDYLSKEGLPALVVYSELWRSNPARFFSNYMPYFNRALLILPVEGSPTLLCGLSPRVYSWIRSGTTIEDVRPAGNFVRPLLQLASEQNWNRIGCLDFEQFPYDLYQALRAESLTAISVDSARVYCTADDLAELTMRRKAAVLARQILAEEIPKGMGKPDYYVAGQLERQFRRSGVEDLIVLLTNGDAPPSPPVGATLGEYFSVSLALEYRGHWVRVSRPSGSDEVLRRCKSVFDEVLLEMPTGRAAFENLGGSYPFECIAAAGVTPHSIVAVHVDYEHNGKRLFYGDTCVYGPSGFKTL
jgi:hypothetical protein